MNKRKQEEYNRIPNWDGTAVGTAKFEEDVIIDWRLQRKDVKKLFVLLLVWLRWNFWEF